MQLSEHGKHYREDIISGHLDVMEVNVSYWGLHFDAWVPLLPMRHQFSTPYYITHIHNRWHHPHHLTSFAPYDIINTIWHHSYHVTSVCILIGISLHTIWHHHIMHCLSEFHIPVTIPPKKVVLRCLYFASVVFGWTGLRCGIEVLFHLIVFSIVRGSDSCCYAGSYSAGEDV